MDESTERRLHCVYCILSVLRRIVLVYICIRAISGDGL